MTPRRARALLLVPAVAVTIGALAAAPPLPHPGTAFLSLAVFVVLFGALEPALVAAFGVAAGTLWSGWLTGTGADAAWGAGSVVAVPLVLGRLSGFRGKGTRGWTLALVAAVAGATGARVFLAAPAVLVVTGAGLDLLLFRENRRDTPRLLPLFGGALAFLMLFALQFLLLLAAVTLAFLPGAALPRLRRLSRFGARSLIRWFPYGRIDLSGIDARTFEQPAIIVSNHQSSVDILLVLGLPVDVRLTLSPRVWKTPTLGVAARKLGHVLVESAEATQATCTRLLAEGASTHFFPEGTRSKDAFPARFHRGAFDLAFDLGRDVVPLLLCDTATCVPRDAFWVNRFRMSVVALPRIAPGEFASARDLMKHTQRVMRTAFLDEHARINTPAVLRRKVRSHYHYQGWRVEAAVRNSVRHEDWLERLGTGMPGTGRVLDLGCGLGVSTHWLAARHPRLLVVGWDENADWIRVARRSAAGTPRVTFACGPLGQVVGPASGALLRPGATRDLQGTCAWLADVLVEGAPVLMPRHSEEGGAALRDAGFAPCDRARYVRGPRD